MEGVEALYHAYRDDVFRLALSYTGQIADAEDISQTVFLKLMDHYSRLTPGKEKNWLLKVAANESRSMLRRRRHLVQETIPEIPFAEPQDSLLFELVQALEYICFITRDIPLRKLEKFLASGAPVSPHG